MDDTSTPTSRREYLGALRTEMHARIRMRDTREAHTSVIWRRTQSGVCEDSSGIMLNIKKLVHHSSRGIYALALKARFLFQFNKTPAHIYVTAYNCIFDPFKL